MRMPRRCRPRKLVPVSYEPAALRGLVAPTLVRALLTLACGQIGTALALRARPGPLLRNE